eukprot:TRINITY_DN16285_c0_g1_i1.p1 TRINITY_DN16285_c0_g1~~TRINITY_DN16285_c0_g1_i1.p1  ORF type:complete len:232 (-),score=27.24 TRINITY_DN16285_c0_g1_i1:733-1428(-)
MQISWRQWYVQMAFALSLLTAVCKVQAGDYVELTLNATGQLSAGDGSKIRIELRPDLSGAGAPAWISQLAQTRMRGGTFDFYRAEPFGIFQGEMRHVAFPPVLQKGPCPVDVDGEAIYKTRQCFEHDPHCGCHGPIMQPGMVGWAGGGGSGPAFFIYIGDAPAYHWSHDHTVWGQLADEASHQVVKAALKLETNENNGMQILKHRIPFTMRVMAPPRVHHEHHEILEEEEV